MPSYSFSKLIPGGNPTILLRDPDLSPAALAETSARLMSPMHIGAEQVGALYSADAGQIPRLRMMGGEFCVNATRAAALLLARQGRLAGLPADASGAPAWGGVLAVSGVDAPVPLLAALDGESLARAVGTLPPPAYEALLPSQSPSEPARARLLHCAARVACSPPEISCASIQPGVALVSMPGMSHALIDIALHPLPDCGGADWRTAARRWRLTCGLADAPASGVIWFRRDTEGFRIWPAVEVKATHSEHLETACGSASLALALWSWQRRAPSPVSVTQPAGEILRVFPAPEAGQAWISGPVFLAAEGAAHV